jgi:hypothetical protein
LPLAFEEGKVQIIPKIISILGNDASKDDVYNVLSSDVKVFFASDGIFLIIVLNN